MTGSAQIIRSDARNLPLADSSVDLVVTSPPYFALRSYKDGGEHYDGQIGDEATPTEFVNALITATREIVRVVKQSGSIWVNLGDKYSRNGGGGSGSSDGALGRGSRPPSQAKEVRPKSLMGIPWRYALACIDDLGLILRAEVIWSKPNGLPESVTDRVRRSHEQWFHFTKSERYYSAMDNIREEYSPVSVDRMRLGFNKSGLKTLAGRRDGDGQIFGTGEAVQVHPLGKLPGSVWTVATEPLQVDPALGVDHFAAFPTEWPRRIILGWSPEGGTVLDPFGGTGTTAAVAKALGRHGIHNDMSADYNRLADWRINGAGFDRVWAKVHNKELVKRDDTQLALFDDNAA